MKRQISLIILTIIILICFCACDGTSNDKLEFEQLRWPTYDNAKQIPIPKSTMADVRNCNSVRFEFYLADTTFEDYKAYVEECKAMGFTLDAIEQENRYYALSEAKYELTVEHQGNDVMYVEVVEQQIDVEIKILHINSESADMYPIEILIDDYYEDDSEIGDEAITFDTGLKEGKHILLIENDDDDDINGRTEFSVSEDTTYLEFTIKCLNNKIEIMQGDVSTNSNIETKSDDVKFGQTEIEKELEMVETLFSLNYKEIMSEYPNAELEYPDEEDIYNLIIEERFAGLSGLYNVCVLDDGTVWRVIFEPENESFASESVVDVITASLGDYIDYDSEWDYYTWKTNNLEIAYWIEDRTYIDWIGEDLEVKEITENKNAEKDDYDDSKNGVVKNIHTAADIPNELMNDEFKNVIELFSKGFTQSGLDRTDATTYDDGETYIFYLDNLEFLGDECENGYFQPRIIYTQDAINNDGTPDELFFEIANPSKSNGYKETVEMVEDIAEALGMSDSGLIDNDYSSSSKLAIGEYATFTFTNLNFKLTVSNTDGTVEIEIVPIEEIMKSVSDKSAVVKEAKDNSSSTQSQTNSSNTNNTKKCEECGKTATKTVNLFGQTEYYCKSHYDEIMDIIDMMESDVGKGSASKHTCEECSSEGTHSIIGISGQTEYYCTKHYKELQELLKIFG